MMKRNKITALLYFITSLLFYVSAILNFTSDVGMGVIYLCLGSTSLCFGATWLNKNKKQFVELRKSEFIKENIDETIFMFALFKCGKSDKGRN